MDRRYFVYIMASRSRVLYIGVTNSLIRRTFQHKQGLNARFTSHYKVHRLVHIESFANVRNATAREKELKTWRREKKLALINEKNPTWEDLSEIWFRKQGRPADPSLRSG